MKTAVAGLTIALGLVGRTLRAQSPDVNLYSAVNSDGTMSWTVENRGASALVACLLWASYPNGGRGVLYRDVVLPGPFEPIPPGLTFVERQPAGTQMTLKAALWADGSSYTEFGDATWVERILDHRSAFKRHAQALMTLLQQTLASGTGAETLVAELRRAMEEIRKTEHPDDFGIASGEYEAMIHRITHPPGHLDGTELSYQEILKVSLDPLGRDLTRAAVQ